MYHIKVLPPELVKSSPSQGVQCVARCYINSAVPASVANRPRWHINHTCQQALAISLALLEGVLITQDTSSHLYLWTDEL